MEEKKGRPYNIPSFAVLLIYHGVPRWSDGKPPGSERQLHRLREDISGTREVAGNLMEAAEDFFSDLWEAVVFVPRWSRFQEAKPRSGSRAWGSCCFEIGDPFQPAVVPALAKVPQAEEWLKLLQVPNWIEPFNFLKYLIMFPIWLPCPIAISIFLQGQTSYEVIEMCNPMTLGVSPRIGDLGIWWTMTMRCHWNHVFLIFREIPCPNTTQLFQGE